MIMVDVVVVCTRGKGTVAGLPAVGGGSDTENGECVHYLKPADTSGVASAVAAVLVKVLLVLAAVVWVFPHQPLRSCHDREF